MRISILVLVCACIAQSVLAQHSVQLDDGAGHYSWITSSNPGGTFILPPGGGTLLTSSNISSAAWSLTGNGGTTPLTNFLGTTDNQALVIKTNSVERLRVLTDGTLGFGTKTPNSTYSTAKFEMASEGYLVPTDMLIRNAVSDPGYAPGYIIEHARGTLAAPTTVLNGDYLGAFWVMAYDGTNHVGSAALDFWSDGAVASGKVPAKILFSTADASTGALLQRMAIRSTGFVGIGEPNPGALLSVGSGNLFQINSSGDLAKIKNVSYSWPGSNAAGVLTNNGSGALSWSAVPTAWLPTGNNLSGSDNVNNVLGTLAASTLIPVHIIVGGTTIMSFTNIGGLGPNVIGGMSSNTVTLGSGSAPSSGINTIGGGAGHTIAGGEANVIGGGYTNAIHANSGGDDDVNTISGGLFNQINSTFTAFGTGLNFIGGGRQNVANGANSGATGYNAVVGGVSNDASGGVSTGGYNFIGGGTQNQAHGGYSFVGGGVQNQAQSGAAAVVAGSTNLASGGLSFIGAGASNISGGLYSIVGGGVSNTTVGISSAVVGGNSNLASGDNSFVGGGQSNIAKGIWSFVGGGYQNNSDSSYATVGGGLVNSARGVYSTVGGGYANYANKDYTGVGSGYANVADAFGSTIAGGTASGTYGTSSFIGGGVNNITFGADATIGGGAMNVATGDLSFVGGGSENQAVGTYSTIGGGLANIDSGANDVIPGGGLLTLSGNGSFGFLGQGITPIETHQMSVSASRTSVFGNTDLWLANNDNTARALYFYAPYNADGAFPNGTKYVGFKAGNVATSVIWTLPTADGTVNQLLTTDGAGNLSWSNVSAPPSWSLTGNSGTTPGTNFVGTTDNQDLYLQVKNGVTLNNGLILNAGGGIQRDNGGLARGVGAIDMQLGRTNIGNVASGDSSVIGGGRDNHTLAPLAVIGGGRNNDAATAAFVGGGSNNQAWVYGVIGGGLSNQTSQDHATVAGGQNNSSGSVGGFIGGGTNNSVGSLTESTIAGGASNTAADGGFIGGGYTNTATTDMDVVGGGSINQAVGGWSTVAGGYNNIDSGKYDAIPGGGNMILTGHGSFGFFGLGDSPAEFHWMTVSASRTSVFANTDLWLANNDNTARAIYFYAPYNTNGAFPNGTKYVGFKAGNVGTSVIWTLPTADGSANQMLQTDGAGTLSWASTLKPSGNLVYANETDNVNGPLGTNTVTISGNVTIATIADPSTFANANIAATVTNATAGQVLIIYNTSGQTVTLNGTNVANNATVQFVYLGSAWRHIQ